MKILLTGATGFVGSALLKRLLADSKADVAVAVRSENTRLAVPTFCVGNLAPTTDWHEALTGREVIIHAAARAHIMKNQVADPLAEYRRVNVEATLNLARQAATAGIRRFIFISSIGVNGNLNSQPFTEEDQPNPVEPYAQSKWEAEQGLQQLATQTGMQVVIIRPPLVYGPKAPGNFGRLLHWVEKGLPLPLGAVHNQRSLVAIDNLVDLIVTCIDHPAAANQVFLAGDGQDLTTTQLLQGLAQAMGKPSRLIPMPAGLLMLGASILGKKALALRLLGSLQVDISKAKKLLGWQPPITLEQGLQKAASRKV